MTTWTYQATVLRVHDGDTIECSLDLGLDLHLATIGVRFAGVDAAELDTPEGKNALTLLQGYVNPGDMVTVQSIGWDKYASRIDAGVTTAAGIDVIARGLAEGWLRPYSGEGPKPWPAAAAT